MMGAVFAEMDEAWASRRWFSEKSIARAVEGSGCRPPAPCYDGDASQRARRIIELVMAGNLLGRRAE